MVDWRPYVKLVRNIFLVIVVYVSIISLFVYTGSKDRVNLNIETAKLQNRREVYRFINDKNIQKQQGGTTVIAVYRLITCGMMGEGCTDNPNDGDIRSKSSVTGLLSQLILNPLNHPPSSGISWVAHGLQESGFVPKSYAAEGIGFAGLKPFAQIWTLFRNFAYLIMVLVVITIGFLIMFRRKVNAQTVVTLENSLPRIVIAFLFITFSFAIAGFLIDLMYLLIFIIISFLGTNTISPFNALSTKAQVLNGGFSLWDGVFANGNYWRVGDALLSVMPSGINIILRIFLGIGSFFILSFTPVIGMVLKGTILTGVGTINGLTSFMIHLISALILLPITFFLAPTIFSIIFFLTSMFVFFRIFFLLFKNYVQIILLIIFAPVLLMLEAIPGQKAFSKWVKMLVANLLAFPVTIGLILLSNIVVAIPTSNLTAATPTSGTHLIPFWSPPLLSSSYTAPDAYSVLVGVGIMFMIPNIIKSIKQVMGIKDGILSGVGPGIFFGGISAASGAGMGGLGKFTSISYGLGGLGRLPGISRSSIGKKLNEVFGQAPHTPH